MEYGLEPATNPPLSDEISSNHALIDGWETTSRHKVDRPDFVAVTNPASDRVDSAAFAVVGDTPSAVATLRPDRASGVAASTFSAPNSRSLSVA
ncbi:hypothetical protein BU204_27140 [Actinophytocola xanthii]|uniref:Uncharacterized protein n=1 Tax=Actinophytocola xanthii TaxID=1912961 RepID=A0A1Q8CGK2_9PSEU|nr:hypothetical protein BU204_27140 [Actinophytocola xanthii]